VPPTPCFHSKLGSPVSLDYYDRAPFPFNGAINTMDVRYLA
jgi:arylsulfatase